MSLNGLDEAAVVEAYQVSLAEAGGWFLLKYASRDTVALLSRGTGGVLETRQAIEQYEEKSPLYGLVQYRRKKFILKYVPDGTSRLLQVRLAVQFQSVLETFTPYDTIFSFSEASELTEAGLGTSAMLGTRAGSLKSSSSSLRRQRLGEISEHVEEGASSRNQPRASSPMAEKKTTTTTTQEGAVVKKEATVPAPIPVVASTLLPQLRLPPASPITLEENVRNASSLPEPRRPFTQVLSDIRPTDKSLPATPNEPEPTPPLTRQDLLFPTTSQEESVVDIPRVEEPEASTPAPRESAQYRRPSIAETDRGSQYSYTPLPIPKPKKKLGPRPHVESQTRPKTSASTTSTGTSRPVANLPNSIQISNRTAQTPSFRPESQQSSKSGPAQFTSYSAASLAPPLPSPNNIHIASLYRAPQHHSIATRPASALPLTPSATPEKLRLMKALQLRKKNMQVAQRASAFAQNPTARDDSNETEGQGAAMDGEDARDSPKDDPPKDEPPKDEPLEDATILRSSVNKAIAEGQGKQTPVSSTASPISTSHLSEKPSTRSSFTEENESPAPRSSISSDTGSSVTPKAAVDPKQPSSPHTTLKLTITSEDAQLEKGVTAESPREEEHARALAALNRPKTGTTITSLDTANANITPPPKPRQYARPGNASETRPESTARSVSRQSQRERDRKRRAVLDPLHAISSPEASEISEDESFMDELQYATVEEAKPISVARSPATPIFSRGSSDRLKDHSRITSSQSHQPSVSSVNSPDRPKTTTSSTRSISSSLPQWPPPSADTVPVPLAKKGTLSQGISKRIKALEVFTTRDSSASPTLAPQVSSPKSRMGFSSFRKRSSFLPPQQTPNMSTTTPPPKEFLQSEPVITPPAETPPSSSTQARPWVQRQGSMTEINAPNQKGESISVTARIIRRDDSKQAAHSLDPTEPMQMNLQRSPLVIEHEKPEAQDGRPMISRDVSFQSLEPPTSRDKTRFSFTSHRSNSQTRLNTSDSMASRMSTASSSKGRSANTFPRSMSETSSIADDKSESRASRLKKRMSILTIGASRSRRSLVGAFSPKQRNDNRSVATIVEHNEVASAGPSDNESLPHVVDVGDLNVQFPDTLLWKRRFMRIDDQGYVIFSQPKAETHTRTVSRRFHLSDFKKPALPDMERQEMSWSIRMELKDGSCVQCACESRHAQAQVLKVLVNAHTAYLQLYAN